MCNYIKKVQANLVEMIEQLAFREQQSDITAFIRRESAFPTVPMPVSEDEEDEKQTDLDSVDQRPGTIMMKARRNDSENIKFGELVSESENEIEDIYNDAMH